MNDLLSANAALVRFDDRAALDQQLCNEIAAQLRSTLAQRDRASLVVSGGSTPIGLFEALSQQQLDWSRVIVTLADERWVGCYSADSNERLVRQHLLQNQAAVARFIGLKTAAVNPEAGAEQCQQLLSELPGTLDVVILGMGEDGHTASFFPGADALASALDPHSSQDCLALTPLTAPHARMTLSLARLLRCGQLYLHLCGEAKLPVLERAMQSGPVEEMPVRAILRQTQSPLAIYWAP